MVTHTLQSCLHVFALEAAKHSSKHLLNKKKSEQRWNKCITRLNATCIYSLKALRLSFTYGTETMVWAHYLCANYLFSAGCACEQALLSTAYEYHT
jgi:hypothetical protein